MSRDKLTIDQLMETMRDDDFGPAVGLFEQDAPPADDIPAPSEPPKPPNPSLAAQDDDGQTKRHESMEAALNDQQNAELTNWYKYYKMAAWLEDKGLPGMADWIMQQARDELEHGERFFRFLADRNQKIVLADIKVMEAEWKTPLEVFKAAYMAEIETTDRIERLHQMADDLHDRQAMSMLNWFLDEQVEEEKVTLDVVQRLERIGNHGTGLNALDRAMGEEAEKKKKARGEKLENGTSEERLREEKDSFSKFFQSAADVKPGTKKEDYHSEDNVSGMFNSMRGWSDQSKRQNLMSKLRSLKRGQTFEGEVVNPNGKLIVTYTGKKEMVNGSRMYHVKFVPEAGS